MSLDLTLFLEPLKAMEFHFAGGNFLEINAKPSATFATQSVILLAFVLRLMYFCNYSFVFILRKKMEKPRR